MSEPFNIGDRVRYKAELVEQGFLHPRKLELTGKILRQPQGKEKCYLVKWNDVAESEITIHRSWLESVPPSGRTFEEIVKELAENPAITREGIKLINVRTADSDSGGIADFTDIDGFGELTLYDDGGISLKYREDWTWQGLAAISAACSEIAANYKAEHGKEEK